MHPSACAHVAVHEGRVLVGVEACPSFVTKVPGAWKAGAGAMPLRARVRATAERVAWSDQPRSQAAKSNGAEECLGGHGRQVKGVPVDITE